MGISAIYYQINKKLINTIKRRVASSDIPDISDEYPDEIISHEYIGKSHGDLSLILAKGEYINVRNIWGQVAIYGQPNYLSSIPVVNSISPQDIFEINIFFNSLKIESIENFKRYYDDLDENVKNRLVYQGDVNYYYNNFLKLKHFYLKCEKESWVCLFVS